MSRCIPVFLGSLLILAACSGPVTDRGADDQLTQKDSFLAG
jgi:hypothetical protein